MSIGRNAPAPAAPAVPALQWANGLVMARPVGAAAAARFAPHVGFHIEAGRDADLDAALADAGATQIEIRHQREGGSQIVRHWALGETIAVLPITSGPVAATVAASLHNGSAAATAAAGIGLRWPAGERSQLAVRCLARPLWAAGYRGLVQLGVRSRMTAALLGALLDHVRVAEAADKLVDRQRHPEPISPAELWLPLGPGPEQEFGSDQTTTVVPLMSDHPEVITRDQIRDLWRSDEQWKAAIIAWPAVQTWAREFAVAGQEPSE